MLSCLTQDQELPVKVEAAVALQSLIKNQELAEQVIRPFVKPIITGMYMYMYMYSIRNNYTCGLNFKDLYLYVRHNI